MSLPALYELAHEYRAAADQLADLELDPQTVGDTLEGLAGDLETKAVNVAKFTLSLEASAAAIKTAEAAMATRRKAIEARAARLREYLLTNMQHAGIQKIECPYFKLAQRENPPAVVIDGADLIPAEFMRQPEPPPPAPDKKAIGDAIKAGRDVPGAHMERGVRLVIN
jgi:hypothetical protein